MIFAIVIALLILLFVQWLLCSPFRWRNKGIKWYIPWPLFGNTAGLLMKPFPDFWMHFYRENEGEKMVGFHFFKYPAILPRSADIIREFMVTDSDSFNSHAFYTSDEDPFKPNIFFAEGERWKYIRSKMSPYFSPTRIKAMTPIIKHAVEDLVDSIASDSKIGPVEVDDISIKFATDTIISTVFGLEGDCFKNSDSIFFMLQKELLGLSFQCKSIIGFMSARLYDFLGLTTFKKVTTDKLVQVVNEVIQSRMQGKGTRPDFIQGMVELMTKENTSENEVEYYSDETKVARFDLRAVGAQCITLFSAGSDTTGHTLAWSLYELAINTDVQDKLRDEITRVKNDGQIEFDEIAQLTYLDSVVSETMRKHPAVPFLFRKCVKSTTLGGVNIDNGTIIVMPMMGIHRNSEFYHQPERFDPDRFAPGTQREAGSYLPFGLGPRQCIGMRLAILEIKLALCALIVKFKITTCSKTPRNPTLCFGPTLKPYDGLYLNFIPLKDEFS